MDFIKFLGRKIFMGACVFSVVTLVFWFKSDAEMFSRYADFGEMVFMTFAGANIAEWFMRREKNPS